MGASDWMDTRINLWAHTYERTLAACCARDSRDPVHDADVVAFAAATEAWGPVMERCPIEPTHGYIPTQLSDMGRSDIRCGLCVWTAYAVQVKQSKSST
jgi:hypothetical protein